MADFRDFDMRPRGAPDAVLSYKDALVACTTADQKWLISSPNVHWIPPPVIGIVDIRVRADGRFGLEDPVQSPQVFCERFAHFATFRRPPLGPHKADDPKHTLYWTPTEADFVSVEGAVVLNLGYIREEMWECLRVKVEECQKHVAIFCLLRAAPPSRLQFAESAMRLGLARLKTTPATFRDMLIQVTGVQRYCLEAQAFMDFMDFIQPYIVSAPPEPLPVRTQYLGAWTTDAAVAQKLFLAGVPIWYLRQRSWVTADVIIRAVAAPVTPRDIVLTGDLVGETVYHGAVGQHHLASMFRGGHTYTDVERTPFPDLRQASIPIATSSRAFGSTASAPAASVRSPKEKSETRYQPYPTNAQHSHRGRIEQQLKALGSAAMPEPLPTWRSALLRVDYNAPVHGQWHHFVPPASLFINLKDEARRQNFLQTWLRTRPAWLGALSNHYSGVPRQLRTQQWRDFFYSFINTNPKVDAATASAKRRQQLEVIFGKVHHMGAPRPDPTGVIKWFTYTFAPDATIPPLTVRQILWEISELGFRYELMELDRVVCPNTASNDVGADLEESRREWLFAPVFPEDMFMHIDRLTQRNRGLADDLVFKRTDALDALIKVMKRWPHCPEVIQSAPVLHSQRAENQILKIEAAMADFYCSTFFQHAGRPATIPHRFPEF